MNFLSNLLSTAPATPTTPIQKPSPLTKSAVSDERFNRMHICWSQSLWELFGEDAVCLLSETDERRPVAELTLIPRDVDATSIKTNLRQILACVVEEDAETGPMDSTGACVEMLLAQDGPLNVLVSVALDPHKDDAFFRKQVLLEVVKFVTDLIRNNVEDLRLLTHASIFGPLNKVLRHFVSNSVRMEMRMEWIQLIHGMCQQIAQEKSILLMFLDGQEGVTFLPLILVELGNDDDVGQFAQKCLEYLTKTMETGSEIEAYLLRDDRLAQQLGSFLKDAHSDEVLERIDFFKRIFVSIPSQSLQTSLVSAFNMYLADVTHELELTQVEAILNRLARDPSADALVKALMVTVSTNLASWLLQALEMDPDDEISTLRFLLEVLSVKRDAQLFPFVKSHAGFAHFDRAEGVARWKRLRDKLIASNRVPTHSFSLESLDFTSEKKIVPIRAVGIRKRVLRGNLTDAQAQLWNEKWIDAMENGAHVDSNHSPNTPTSPKLLPHAAARLSLDESEMLLKQFDEDKLMRKIVDKMLHWKDEHPEQVALHGALVWYLLQSPYTSVGEYLLFSPILHAAQELDAVPSLLDEMTHAVAGVVTEKQSIFPPGILSSVLVQAQQSVLQPTLENRKKALETYSASREWYWQRVVTLEEWLVDIVQLLV